MPVRIARHGEIAQPGAAWLAPDGCQMGVEKSFRITCEDGPAEHGLRPSAAFLFRAVAERFGAEAAGVLLTGMGRDGAEELKRMRDAGAVTFAQDKESSVVHGMPGEAIRLGAAMHVGPPERIAALLSSLLPPHRPHHTP
jgi:two-component system chemotaxis response regulator CheB